MYGGLVPRESNPSTSTLSGQTPETITSKHTKYNESQKFSLIQFDWYSKNYCLTEIKNQHWTIPEGINC